MGRLTLFAALLFGCSSAPRSPEPKGVGESCAMPFRLDGASSITFGGTTVGFDDDDDSALSSCGGTGGSDLVFTFIAAISAIVDVKVTPEVSGYQPIVKVRGADRGCMAVDDACDTAISRGQVAEIKSWSPATGGVQYVIVDGQAQTSGAFTLEVKQR